MGRLYGRPLDENGGIEFRRSPEDAREADAQLGKKVREMLAKEGSPAGYRREVGDAAGWPDGETVDRLAGAGWNWVRCELLGEEPGSLKTGRAVGERLELIEGEVYCDRHGCVHPDTLDPYHYPPEERCEPSDHRPLYTVPEAQHGR